jgi:hypothetical protein
VARSPPTNVIATLIVCLSRRMPGALSLIWMFMGAGL